MKRILISDIRNHVGSEVTLAGWVHIRRDHGKLIFIDLRDESGIVQMVALPNHKEAHIEAGKLRSEWVVEIKGIINKRPEKMVNKNEALGDLEIEITSVAAVSEAETPPFDLTTPGTEIGEEHRLKYRYLDLRRPRMHQNLVKRSELMQFVRNYLVAEKFVEVETPILTRSTPEGARDYIVPSRIEPGKFYALPQSPQQYKQLLMVGGVGRYFQLARCMRDEDTRGDRQPEFTQLDIEMSFVEQEDVMALNEKLLIELVGKHFPEKRIQQVPFPRISYKDAMEKYGSDRPDIREDKNDPNLLAFAWVVDFPFFEKTEDGWTFTHNPFSRPKPEHIESLMGKKKIGEILTTQYDIVLNGFEVGGGSIRNHDAAGLRTVFEIMGHKPKQIEEDFGHMLTAFAHGAPPHGGIAWGFDRLCALLMNEPNIREVIAFPKTGEGRDLMMNAPSEVASKQLKELGIEIPKKKK